MAGSPGFPNLSVNSPRRLPRRLATRAVPDQETAAGHSCAMNTQPCLKALSGLGRMRRFGGTAGGVPTRFRELEDRIRKLGAVGAWLCCVLMIGLGVSPSAIAHETVTYIHTERWARLWPRAMPTATWSSAMTASPKVEWSAVGSRKIRGLQ